MPTSEAGLSTTVQPPDKRVFRRKQGPFKRSRTGCTTCKRRGKKCDEEWSETGACQRCIAGQWDCNGRTSPVKRVRHQSSASTRTASAEPEPQTGTPNKVPSVLPLDLPAHVNAVPGQPTSLGGPPVAPSIQSQPSIGVLTSTTLPSIQTQPSPLSAFIPHNQYSTTYNNPLSTWTLPTPTPLGPQPLWNWPNSGGTAAPSAFLTTCEDGSLAIDSTPPSWPSSTGDSNAVQVWDDLDAIFGNGQIASDRPSASGGMSAFHAGSRVLFISSDKPQRQGVSLAEIYARVVESWLVGLPSAAREYARNRILALHDSNSVMRAVRYAVSAAYIFLFASDPQGPQDQRPKLVELACRGAGLIKGQTKAFNSNSPDEDSSTKGSNAIRKIRLYVDHVSTPFAADLESTKWTEDAIQELRQVIVTEQKQLSDLLWGVIDLQLVEFIRGGAAPSYNMLALGDRLVRNFFHEDHPAVTLSQLRTSDTFSLRLFALSDISRCIVNRGRKTLFNLWTDHGSSSLSTPPESTSVEEDETWSTYLGLPDRIVILLAEVVNLCADLSISSKTSVLAQAEELEAAITGWTPNTSQSSATLESTALVSRTIAGQLWRLCALILLYQASHPLPLLSPTAVFIPIFWSYHACADLTKSVHRVGSLHPTLRRSRDEILSLLDAIARLPNGDLWGFIALPAFLAGALSISDSDRQRSMRHMVRPGPERVWLDNIALVEKLWEECDETGRLADWHDKMTREGLSVAFF